MREVVGLGEEPEGVVVVPEGVTVARNDPVLLLNAKETIKLDFLILTGRRPLPRFEDVELLCSEVFLCEKALT